MIGKQILHYRIIEKLGAGGMGVVYKAEDTKLKRMIALKFLPPHVSLDNEAKERFMHEAQAASALDHNNICTIYEIGESEDGQMYMSMALYEGETLQDEIERGPLPLEEAINIAVQIAEGLAKAHEKDIVHRDIKPANIMITSDRVAKILDFGLAKLSGRTKLTKEGTTIGTVAYMSPEQVRGEKADHRTDIWALGVILYEMITGKSPFKGEYDQAIMYSIVNEEPEPLNTVRTEMQMELKQIVKKCLQKNPVNRYQHAEGLAVDLRRMKAQSESGEKKVSRPAQWKWKNRYFIAGAAMMVVILLMVLLPRSKTPEEGIIETSKNESIPEWQNSIAVLPFKNISADKEQEYFCDGMTEQLITNLSNLPNIKVIANTSVMHFKNSNETIQQIAHELGVDHILDGSVRKSGNKIRVTAQLINTEDGSLLWAKDYDRALRDIFDLQDNLSNAIVEALRINLTGEQRAAFTKRYTDNHEAYQLYLKGLYHARMYTPEGVNRAIEYFNKAIAIDPNYSLAYDGLAYCYYAGSWWSPWNEVIPKARAFAKKALEIDPTLAEAHSSLGVIYTWADYDWSAAEQEFKQAISLNPNAASAHLWYGFLLLVLGQSDESIAEFSRAVELDPLSAEANTSLGAILFYLNRYDEAMKQLRTTIELEPNYWFAHLYHARVQEQKGNFDAAISELEETKSMKGAAWEVWSAQGYAYAVSGNKDMAQKIIYELKEQSKQSFVPPYNLATVYAGLGEKDRAFEYLEKEYEQGYYYLCYLGVDPELDSLRSDPRFATLLKKLGMPDPFQRAR